MSKIILTVLKEDFDGASFLSPWTCVLARAANRQFDIKNAAEGVTDLRIGLKTYTHKPYGDEENRAMRILADKSEPGSVIFTIDLELYEPVQD